MRPQDRIVCAPDLVFAEIDDGAVGLNPESGVCFGLNRTGLRILKSVATPASVVEICQQVLADYDVDPQRCEREVVALLRDLEAEGLVVIHQAPKDL